MYTHQLSETHHKIFLAEGRRDPYSQSELSPGDTIVFCASCKIAHLEDSWKASSNKCALCKCEATLSSFPRIGSENEQHRWHKTKPARERRRFHRSIVIIGALVLIFFAYFSVNTKDGKIPLDRLKPKPVRSYELSGWRSSCNYAVVRRSSDSEDEIGVFFPFSKNGQSALFVACSEERSLKGSEAVKLTLTMDDGFKWTEDANLVTNGGVCWSSTLPKNVLEKIRKRDAMTLSINERVSYSVNLSMPLGVRVQDEVTGSAKSIFRAWQTATSKNKCQ